MRKTFTFFVFAILFFTLAKAQAPAGYYDPASGLTGTQLKTALYNIIKGHTEYPYTSTATDVWDILKESDRDPNNADNVILLYTGWSVNAAQEYNDGLGWTREHVWAKSRGDFGTTNGPGTDCHNLRPCDVSVNSARNNRWFAECNEMYYDDGIATGSYTSSTEWLWKPRNEVKGDVARMIFYMATRYEGENDEPDLEPIDYIPADQYTLLPIHAKLSDLLLWNQEDPVDAFEQNRNDVVYSYQHNRNPFIDHPEYIEAIWGSGTLPNLPDSPTNLTLSVGQSQLDLSWTDVSNEDGYYLYRSTDNTNFTSIATLAANTTVYSDASVSSNTTYYYYIKAYNAEGTSTASATVSGEITSTSGTNATDLFFSEYIEGSSYNKALELANFTGANLDLSAYVIKKQTNGAGDWSTGLALAGTLANGQTYVIANTQASQTVLDQADLITGVGEMTFNGNDAVSLWKNGVLIDIIGTFNDATVFAADVTKIRNSDVSSPTSTYTTSEWTNYPIDYFDNLGAHTFDGASTTPTTCDVPTGLTANNITTSSADLSWNTVTDATDYTVQYKESTASAWTSLNTTSTSVSLSGLTASTTYNIQVATNCASGTSDFSTIVQFTTADIVVASYCTPVGNTKFEWIDYVELSNVQNTSGASPTGYSDFTTMVANLTPGSSYSIYFQAGFARKLYTEYWSVWIDFNQDGDFEDSDELLAEGYTTDANVYYMTLNIPSYASGETRMRISMNDAGFQTPCYNPKYGEVEDYSVSFGTAKSLSNSSALVAQKAEKPSTTEQQLVYPNPAHNTLFIDKNEHAFVQIYSLSGKLVLKTELTSNRVDIHELNKGMYLVKIDDGTKVHFYKFVKQ